jgi:Zn finger protein HypA/HybF involved in hydrogenase expression
MEELKRCSKCKISKPLNEFHKRKNSKDGHDHYCKECSNARHRIKYATDPMQKLNAKYRKYNINHDEFINMYNAQNGKCKICNEPFKRRRHILIDHNHVTESVRGLLCPKCNILLGSCNDNIETLKLAINYLEEYK